LAVSELSEGRCEQRRKFMKDTRYTTDNLAATSQQIQHANPRANDKKQSQEFFATTSELPAVAPVFHRRQSLLNSDGCHANNFHPPDFSKTIAKSNGWMKVIGVASIRVQQ